MVVYAVGSAGLAVADQADLRQRAAEPGAARARSRGPIVGVYLLKGIGSYVSSYLMADVGQRVVMDLRNALYRHILGQSAGFFAQRRHRPADVAHQQRRRAGAAGGVGNRRRSRARDAGARRLRGAAVLDRRAAGARLHDRRAAHRLSAGPARPARAADDAAQPGGARAALAHQRRGVHRPPHRQGVRHRAEGSREASRAPATTCFAPT